MIFWIWEIACGGLIAFSICFLIEIHHIEKHLADYHKERGLGEDLTK